MTVICFSLFLPFEMFWLYWLLSIFIWGKMSKNEPSKICGKPPLKIWCVCLFKQSKSLQILYLWQILLGPCLCKPQFNRKMLFFSFENLFSLSQSKVFCDDFKTFLSCFKETFDEIFENTFLPNTSRWLLLECFFH